MLKMSQALEVYCAASPHQPVNFVPLGEEKLGQVGAVLARDTGDQCRFAHDLPPWKSSRRGSKSSPWQGSREPLGTPPPSIRSGRTFRTSSTAETDADRSKDVVHPDALPFSVSRAHGCGATSKSFSNRVGRSTSSSQTSSSKSFSPGRNPVMTISMSFPGSSPARFRRSLAKPRTWTGRPYPKQTPRRAGRACLPR